MTEPLKPEAEALFRKIRKAPEKLAWLLGFDKLRAIHGEWIKMCYTSKADISLRAHRNSYKTTALSIVGPIWYLLFNPDARIMILRDTHTAACATVDAIRQNYEKAEMVELYRTLYGVDNLKTKNWSQNGLTLSLKTSATPEGNLTAMGLDTSKTGYHFDIIQADDVVTKEDRYSKKKRENTKAELQELKNIKIKPSGITIFSGTPWHKDDAHSVMPKPHDYPFGTVDLSPEELAAIKAEMDTMPESLKAANYYLKHIADENRIFPDPTYAPWPDFPTIAVLDPAYDGDCNTALAIGGINRDTGRFFIRGYTWRKAVDAMYSTILDALKMHNVGTLYVEKNADKGLSARDLHNLRGGNVQAYPESMNKHNKIIGYLRKNWPKIDFAEDVNMDFMSEILEYDELSGYNDAPDAAAGLMRILTASRPQVSVGFHAI